jgi:hypothetical protein
MAKSGFQCAICGNGIDRADDEFARSLEVFSLWNKTKATQAIYTHSSCLAGVLHKSVPFEADLFDVD